MSFVDFAVTYFTSQPILLTLGLLFSSVALLSALFRFEKHRPQMRLRILFVSFAMDVLTWSFIASSLILCRAFLSLYETSGDLAGVETVFGLSILVSLVIALPLSAFVTFKVPGAVARSLMQGLPPPERAVTQAGLRTATGLGLAFPRLLQSPSGVPFAYSVGGAESVVVVSRGLVTNLDEDEVETVLAHEFAHLKNHDTALNTIIAVHRRILFFDPFVRVLERAIYSEKEFSADELSARATKKPLLLASALLKISSAQAGGRAPPVKVGGFSILGSSKILRPPNVKLRIERLMMLAAEFDRDALLHGHVPAAR
ncbi:MAG TPA: M48 family metalloprotease [Spirochaetia bacterium]|nr:M48 family metalloprotease [Spirochaetia bacterium]